MATSSLSPEQVLDYYVNFAITNAAQYKQESLDYSRSADYEARRMLYAVSELSRDGELNDVEFLGIDNSVLNLNTIADLRNEFDSKYHYLFDLLSRTVPTEFSKFINDYMPKPSNFDNLEKFLVDSVFNGSIGLPPEIERQIWEAERERTNLENNKIIIENRKSMASRGFIEPNGVEMYREMLILNQGSKNISGSSRAIAVESAKLKIDWIKFAISEARNYRTLAMESAFKYLSYVLSVNDPALRYASGYVDSYKTFYDAVNTYYNSVNTINRLKLEKANMIDRRNYDYDKFFVDQVVSQDEQRIRTFTALAQSMGTQASAALSAINSIVNLGSTSVTTASTQ